MELWSHWCKAIGLLRPAFSRHRTFLWFALCVAGISVRSDNLGVTSIVRGLALDGNRHYERLLAHCHSSAIKLPALGALWTRAVLRLFGERIERVNGRVVLLADGKKMPAVKRLHQQSDSSTRPNFIMGHSCQAISVLARSAKSYIAVPLAIRIHEGVKYTNRDKRTLFDKLLSLLDDLRMPVLCYLVADAYYTNKTMIKGLIANDNHLISRVKSNAVAYYPADKPRGKPKRGRPRIYGKKIKLASLFGRKNKCMEWIPSPVYDDKAVMLKVCTVDLLWRPAGRIIRFVLVEHPRRGRIMLMCTDLTLSASDIIRLYGLRFKIELGFKQASQLIGTYDYHFRMMDVKPLKRGHGNQHLHRADEAYRDNVRRKLRAYEVHMFMGIVAQGLMQYLSACYNELVWRSFGSRTNCPVHKQHRCRRYQLRQRRGCQPVSKIRSDPGHSVDHAASERRAATVSVCQSGAHMGQYAMKKVHCAS